MRLTLLIFATLLAGCFEQDQLVEPSKDPTTLEGQNLGLVPAIVAERCTGHSADLSGPSALFDFPAPDEWPLESTLNSVSILTMYCERIVVNERHVYFNASLAIIDHGNVSKDAPAFDGGSYHSSGLVFEIVADPPGLLRVFESTAARLTLGTVNVDHAGSDWVTRVQTPDWSIEMAIPLSSRAASGEFTREPYIDRLMTNHQGDQWVSQHIEGSSDTLSLGNRVRTSDHPEIAELMGGAGMSPALGGGAFTELDFQWIPYGDGRLT